MDQDQRRIANREEAKRCEEMGDEAFNSGDYGRACRFYSISYRLDQQEEVARKLQNAREIHNTTHRPNENIQRPFEYWVFLFLPEAFSSRIHPTYKRPLAFVMAAILLLSIYRFFFHSSGSTIGRLPGDFNYKSDNFQIFAPLSSSIVVSFALTLLVNILRNRE